MGSIQERFRIEMILHQQPVCLKMGMNHNKENGKISNGGKSGKYSLSEPSTFFLQESCTLLFFSRTDNIECRARDWGEDSALRTRDTDAHFSRVVHT